MSIKAGLTDRELEAKGRDERVGSGEIVNRQVFGAESAECGPGIVGYSHSGSKSIPAWRASSQLGKV